MAHTLHAHLTADERAERRARRAPRRPERRVRTRSAAIRDEIDKADLAGHKIYAAIRGSR